LAKGGGEGFSKNYGSIRVIIKMKKWLILAGVILFLFVGGYLLLSFYAVKLIEPRIQKAVGPGMTFSGIQIRMTHLSVLGIRYEDPGSKKRFLQIDEIRIYPDLFSFLKKRMEIREWRVLKPSFFFERSEDGKIIGPWIPIHPEEKDKKGAFQGERKEESPFRIRIERFRILKGTIDFNDRKAGEVPGRVRLRDLDLDLKDIHYPILSTRSPLKLKGKMMGKGKGGEIHSQGWIDFKTLDMNLSLKVREVELRTFEPYYRERVSAEIESGHINLEAQVIVKERMIDLLARLEIADLLMKEGGTVFYVPAKTLLPLLKENENRIRTSFRVKGNLNDPQFQLKEALLTQMAVSLLSGLGFPVKIAGEAIPRESGKGSGGWVEGLRSLEEMFGKKEKKK